MSELHWRPNIDKRRVLGDSLRDAFRGMYGPIDDVLLDESDIFWIKFAKKHRSLDETGKKDADRLIRAIKRYGEVVITEFLVERQG